MTKEQEQTKIRMAIIKKWLEVTDTDKGVDTFFAYNQAMQEYANLIAADRDKRILELEKENESLKDRLKVAIESCWIEDKPKDI